MTSLSYKIQLLRQSEKVLNNTFPLIRDTRNVKHLVEFSMFFYTSLKLSMLIERYYGRHINN